MLGSGLRSFLTSGNIHKGSVDEEGATLWILGQATSLYIMMGLVFLVSAHFCIDSSANKGLRIC